MSVDTYNAKITGVGSEVMTATRLKSRPSTQGQAPSGSHWRPSTRAKKRFRFAIDTLVLAAAFLLAYKLRFDFSLPVHQWRDTLVQLPIVVAIELLVLRIAGVSRFVWRYTGLREVRTFVGAGLASVIPLLALRFALPAELEMLEVPLSVTLMNMALAFGGLVGMRVIRRVVFEQAETRRQTQHLTLNPKKPILLVGAGHAGITTVREIQSRADLDLTIVGFVDDNLQIQNTVIAGVKVLGTTADLPELVRKHAIDHVVITLVQGSRKQFRQIIETCEAASAKVRVIPSLSEIIQGSVSVSRIRDVQVEDLLGREPILLEESELARFLCGKVVIVTGAGGSIGSELVRQVARFDPAQILLIERAEPSLFEIHRELVSSYPSLAVIPLVADVCDENRIRRIFDAYHPQVIFHAAAHKHVPMMEMNPAEAVKNNVLATRSLAELAGQRGVETFVLVSTDKAVCPSSMMGASKRVSELVIQSLNQRYEATRYVAVRFGNVIGSTGSVIKVFQDQIRKGGPVTVTDPRMFRYFMTIPEATRLLLQAGAIGEGGEILILDMGEPVSILELAEDTITLSGLKPFEDIEVVFIGARPGEKLLEQLDLQSESFAKTRHPKIFIGKIAAYPEAEVKEALERLEDLANREAHEELRAFLSQLLPEAELDHQHPRSEKTAGRLGRQNGRLRREPAQA
ncbi:MAG TPA: nucleoside-diphosphate sugar epimerase/dehydratase [Pyrinomonadaceae bacterium]|nr:nucleoside-diphosphate sugar epimerase/dehydratase [Pyrinomonadaceae bacterium]